MKLLIATGIYPPEIGGPAGYVRGLASELAVRGHQVSVVTYGTDETRKSHWADNHNFNLTVIPRTFGPLIRYCRYVLAVHRLAGKVDLVYLQGPVSEGLPGAIGAMLARKSYVLKVVGDYAWEQYQQNQQSTKYGVRSTAEGVEVLRTPYSVPELLDEFLTHRHSGKVWLMEAIERWVAKHAKMIIVPSKYLKTVVERWGIESQKIKVVYNSIPPLPEKEIPLNLPLTRETSNHLEPLVKGAGDFRKTVLTVVRAVPWKGGDFLCDCLKELPSEYHLVIVGDGPSLDSWKRHAQEIGVADRVQWLGRLTRQEVAQWYRRADIFVLATGYEGFPHVVVEACSVGLPCIVSDRGGNPETKNFFTDLVTVVPYLDKEAWKNAIVDNTQIEPRRLKFSKVDILRSGNATKLIFSRMVDETLEVLQSNV